MSVYAGIDCGGSCTKICLLRPQMPPEFLWLPREADPRAVLPGESLFLGITGVRAREINWKGFASMAVPEYEATAAGARRLSGLSEALVANCGTGTTFLHAAPDKAEHLGGSGIGGGMLPGLGLRLLGTDSIPAISELAARGDLRRVDLNIADFSNTDKLDLDGGVTVSNFGKLNAGTAPEDIALALLNALYQTVGVMAALAAKGCGLDQIVITGGAAEIPLAKPLLDKVGELCRVQFHRPANAAFATALGAAGIMEKQMAPVL